MFEWIDHLVRAVEAARPTVLLTIAQAKGSTPRELGAKLVVTPDDSYGSIGGGNLEFQAVKLARDMLAGRVGKSHIAKMPLGPTLGQCCGGNVTVALQWISKDDLDWIAGAKANLDAGDTTLIVTGVGNAEVTKRIVPIDQIGRLTETLSSISRDIERFARNNERVYLVRDKSDPGAFYLLERIEERRPTLMLFGAGHVGRALVRVLDGTPLRIRWIDSRSHEFPQSIPYNVTVHVTNSPLKEIAGAPGGCLYLVMTHSHPVDLAICEAVLRGESFAFLGLIGSQTKKSRFVRQLRDGGINDNALDRLICPIGIDGIDGKTPAEIAIAVAAQLLQHVGCAPPWRVDIRR